MSPRLLNTFSVVPQTLEAATRPCTQCKRLVPSTQKLKTCEKCRRKDREKSARKAAKRKGAGDVSMKRALVLVDLDESEGEGRIGGEGWDQMRKRIKMEFDNAKRKGKVPVVKNTESMVRTSLYSPQLNSKIYLFYNRNAHPYLTMIQHPTNPNHSSSPPSPHSLHPNQ
jgi:hypothetical protein